jgi:hypothetical protein
MQSSNGYKDNIDEQQWYKSFHESRESPDYNEDKSH